MRMLSAGVFVLACFGLVTVWFIQPTAPPGLGAFAVAQSEEQRAVQFELNRARRDAFVSFVNGVCADVEAGRINLELASEQILAYCQSYYPTYLEHLEPVEKGATCEEKIARNLVRHFHMTAHSASRPLTPAFSARLDRELQTIVNANGNDRGDRKPGNREPRYTVQ